MTLTVSANTWQITYDGMTGTGQAGRTVIPAGTIIKDPTDRFMLV
jgi:hypothetical protein